MSLGGTAAYGSIGYDVPELVRTAVAEATRVGFEFCVRPEIGRLLATCAAALPVGSLVAETGTGTGAGLAWMVSVADPGVRFFSYELDTDRAAIAENVFGHLSNVDVVCGDAAELFNRGPFDLLVLDGGPGSGKTAGSPVDPVEVLRPGGTMTIDDFTPATSWPPMHEGQEDASRVHWLSHPNLKSTEVRVAPDLAVLVCRYLPHRNVQ
jgi:predicted O-methyltransferase YrrM